MKIALEAEVWSRLYGPYGNHSVNRQLISLSKRWDIAVAKELFWEELHHQEDIYPATFAALPWLVELAPTSGEGFEETSLFLSHIIYCACTPGGTGCVGKGPRGKYRGLSTEISDHQHSWIPEHEWLIAEDLPVLVSLENWFADHCWMMAKDSLRVLGPDLSVSAYALEGFATLNGSSRVIQSALMFAGGHDISFIHEELGDYDESDTVVVERLYPYLVERNAELASFMLGYPGCTFLPNDPAQARLF